MATKKKDIDHYLGLKWTYHVEEESYEGQRYYVIRVNELPGVCTDSESLEEGMRDIKEAMRGALELYISQGTSIPEPVDKERFKGNITYRTSPERHYNVARMAQQEQKSMSKILDLLVDAGMKHFRPSQRM